MRRPRSAAVPVVAGAAALLLPASAAIAAGDAEWSGWNAYWENDSFVRTGGTDDAFTNGIRLAVARHPSAPAAGWIDWLPRWLERNAAFDRGKTSRLSTSLVAGQNFFTPLVITDYEVDPDDRPYAGLVYVGLRSDLTEDAEVEVDPEADPLGDDFLRPRRFQSRRQQSVEVTLGMMGPLAGADPVQSSVHAALRTHRMPKGWPHQIGNFPAIAAQYSVRQKMGWEYFDVIPHGGALVGTTQIYPFAGLTARVGWHMTGFPALVGRQTAASFEARSPWEIGFLAGVEGRYFLWNAFVHGHLGDGLVDPVRPVGDYRLGCWLRLDDWRFNYTFLRRSAEVAKEGPSEGLYDRYGSISVAYEPDATDPTGIVKFLMKDVLGRGLHDFILEAGIGPDLRDGREPGVDHTHGMRVAVGRSLWGWFRDLDVAFEIVGVGREFGPPPVPDGDHADRFLVNKLATLRYRPFGGRLGPGECHVRAGVGGASSELEITPGVPGDRDGPCPPGTSFDGDKRYCTVRETGTGTMIGAGYTLSWGRDFGFHTDLSWNQLSLDDTWRFLALTFGFRWAPRG